jgi:cardiolipin synthase (CMP-forming)
VNLSFLPNALCILRMLLVAPCVLALLGGHYDVSLLIFGIAAVSDGLDGWLAKTFGWTSRLGKILDPIADKLLLVGIFIALAVLERVPVWLVAAVVLRDVVIVVGAAAYHHFIGYLEGRPTVVSKLNTFLQLSFVLLVIGRAGHPSITAGSVTGLGAAVFVTTVVSGIDYVLTYAREAVRARAAS